MALVILGSSLRPAPSSRDAGGRFFVDGDLPSAGPVLVALPPIIVSSCRTSSRPA